MAATSTRFRIEWFDFNQASADDIAQINEVYRTVFRDDIGIEFNPSLDEDCVTPAKYYIAAVRGAYIVVRDREDGGRIVGTAGLRALPYLPNQVELKRMFFLAVCRGHKLGYQVEQRLVHKATEMGYSAIVLDTRRKLRAANKIYEAIGFVDCENYNKNPRADRFMRLRLPNRSSLSQAKL